MFRFLYQSLNLCILECCHMSVPFNNSSSVKSFMQLENECTNSLVKIENLMVLLAPEMRDCTPGCGASILGAILAGGGVGKNLEDSGSLSP